MTRQLRGMTALLCAAVLAPACMAQPLPPPPPVSPQASFAQAEGVGGNQFQPPEPPRAEQQVAQYYPPPENPYGEQRYGSEQPYMGQSPYQAPGGSPYGSYGGSPYPRPNSGPFIYPSRGQSPEQEQTDKGQCYTWSVQQSGFDPANPPLPTSPPPQAGPPQGGLFRGAAGGAALGAIGGAIGGNAGKGAAMGAAMGGVFGGMRRRRWMQQAEYQQASYQQQQQNVLTQGRANYNRAFRACMSGRGYTLE
jgi:Glycine zipper